MNNNNTKNENEILPGQMDIFDYPEYLPEHTQEEE